MNGSTPPADASAPAGPPRHVSAPVSPNAQANGDASPPRPSDDPPPAPETAIAPDDTTLPDAPAQDTTSAPSAPNGDGDDAESEAETLITSPVKKKEAEKQQQQQQQQDVEVKTEPKPQRSRIGGLPVPGEDDEDVDSAESPMVSTENATPARKDDDAHTHDEAGGSDRDAEGSESEELSSAQSDEDAEGEEDEEARRSEADEGDANGATADSPNPRKRKHRASSASLPTSKRRSMDPPKRRLRGMHSEADAPGAEGSASPRLHSHRRAISTQSAFDAGSENAAGRKRKSQFPVKEPKSAPGRSGWEESDASSETASRGHPEELLKRSSRGIGRSTSTPGRPGGREHKRHVNKYGFTKLAEACEEGKLDLVKELREKDPDSLEMAEYAGNKPLQIASLNGNADVVEYLIGQGCQIDCANVDKDTPLIDAAENGHVEVVKLLLDAGVDPLSQNLKGQQALDVVTDDTDDAPEIRTMIHKAIDAWNSSSARQKRAVKEEIRHGTGPSKELHFMARTYENLLRLVANNDRNGVREFLAARVPVDNAVIAVAAKTGDSYLVNMLLAEMSEKKARQRAEKPMLAVLGTSHWEMVQALTELETFDPMFQDRQGRTWMTLAEERAGPNWRQERDLLQKLRDQQAKNSIRRSSSPVSRRDGGGKRFLRRQNVNGDGSDEDTPADVRRKNGRRLMSRKDMRAASNKALSDSSDVDVDEDADADADGEIDEDVVMEGESTMGPPDTPNRLRTAAGRTRSKSNASQSSEVSPRTRRRSASLRESRSGDKSLPAVEEAPEETEIKQEEQQKAEEAMAAVQEAQRLAAKQKEEADAEAEAKRAEEEAEAARLRAEEERKADEERRHREAEEAEQARKRAAEEAEAERQRQIVRDKEAAEAREAREKRKTELLASLPPSLRHVLLPTSDFTYEGLEEKAYLVQHFTPLQVLKTSNGDEWVPNVQAAALVGKDAGLAMLLGDDFSSDVLELSSDPVLHEAVEEVVAAFPTTAKADADAVMVDAHDEDDFAAELARTAERLNVQTQLRRALLSPTSPVRLTKLAEIRQRLHPLLRDVQLEVQQPAAPGPDVKMLSDGEDGGLDFLRGARALFAAQLAGPKGEGLTPSLSGWTEVDVAVVHEK